MSLAAARRGLSAAVPISARVSTAHEAFQAGGLVVRPVVALLLGRVSGVLFLGPTLALGPILAAAERGLADADDRTAAVERCRAAEAALREVGAE